MFRFVYVDMLVPLKNQTPKDLYKLHFICGVIKIFEVISLSEDQK